MASGSRSPAARSISAESFAKRSVVCRCTKSRISSSSTGHGNGPAVDLPEGFTGALGAPFFEIDVALGMHCQGYFAILHLAIDAVDALLGIAHHVVGQPEQRNEQQQRAPLLGGEALV